MTEEQFQLWVKCFNCVQMIELFFKKGTLVHNGRLNLCKCPRCGVKGQLKKVQWDGVKYVKIK